MREILFRGKRVDNGEWVYGYYAKTTLTDSPMCIGDCRINNLVIENGTMWHVIPETVGQYTGLNGSNGKKIFEGDILLIDEKTYYGGIYTAPIKWIDYSNKNDNWAFFGITCMDCVGENPYHDSIHPIYTRGFLTRRFGACIQLSEITKDNGKYQTFIRYEVIGNIHDNPELLEEA